MTEYHYLIFKPVVLMAYSNTTIYGGNEYDKSGHLFSLINLKHLMVLFKCISLGLHLLMSTCIYKVL